PSAQPPSTSSTLFVLFIAKQFYRFGGPAGQRLRNLLTDPLGCLLIHCIINLQLLAPTQRFFSELEWIQHCRLSAWRSFACSLRFLA
ncbi:MAG: hypothetical protein M1457_14170, partial [bacterium]|nr:hypothetical protein [bacterium]